MLKKTELDGSIQHSDLIKISKWLLTESRDRDEYPKTWRLFTDIDESAGKTDSDGTKVESWEKAHERVRT